MCRGLEEWQSARALVTERAIIQSEMEYFLLTLSRRMAVFAFEHIKAKQEFCNDCGYYPG